MAEKIGQTSLMEYHIILDCARDLQTNLCPAHICTIVTLFQLCDLDFEDLTIRTQDSNQIVIVYLVLCLFHNSPPYFQFGLALDTKVGDVRHRLITL